MKKEQRRTSFISERFLEEVHFLRFLARLSETRFNQKTLTFITFQMIDDRGERGFHLRSAQIYGGKRGFLGGLAHLFEVVDRNIEKFLLWFGERPMSPKLVHDRLVHDSFSLLRSLFLVDIAYREVFLWGIALISVSIFREFAHIHHPHQIVRAAWDVFPFSCSLMPNWINFQINNEKKKLDRETLFRVLGRYLLWRINKNFEIRFSVKISQ